MRKIALCLLLPLFAPALAAQGIESSGEISLQITSQPAAQLGFSWGFDFPFLRGDGALTRGNGISVAPSLTVTPVSLRLGAQAVWTPAAFAEIVAGASVGSGWNLRLFGSDLFGVGLNLPGEGGAAAHDGGAFDGAIWELRAGAALQGDLAAFFPGRWNHVIARTYHEIRRGGYSRARDGQAWFFENDDGENRNGFSYRGNLLVGYRMPLALNMIALQAEAQTFLTRLPGGERWGDGMARWTFSALLNFALADRLDVALIAQLRTRRNYLEPGWSDLHFTYRALDRSQPRRVEFHRVALALTYRL